MMRTSILLRACLVLLSAFGGQPIDAAGFQQAQRLNSLAMQFGIDSFATNNQLGSAFTSLAQPSINDSFAANVMDGSLSLLLTFPNLTDLRGSNQASVVLGGMNATPFLPAGNPATYSGSSDLDWWYTPNPSDVDSAGQALQTLSGSITGAVLNAGPGRLAIGSSGGLPLALSTVFMRASVGPSSAPVASTNQLPPGRRPGEKIDPALVSFATMTGGRMRGNVAASALAATPIPEAMLGTCGAYTETNSMLDLVVGGCTAFGFLVVVRPSQPDQADTDVPLVGAGPPYRFSAGTDRRINGCRDRLNNPVDLQAGLAAAAYSSYFIFTTDRVIALTPSEIVVNQLPAATNISSGSMLSFGSVPAGTNADLSFTIVNAGLAELTNVAVAFEGPDAAMFSVVSNAPAVIPGANGASEFIVRFTPAGSGPRSATMHISSSDADENPFSLALEGSGIGITAPTFTGISTVENGAMRLLFTNQSGASFTVLSATNIELPLAEWAVAGSATQAQSGLFEFIDLNATNYARRFYRVRSP